MFLGYKKQPSWKRIVLIALAVLFLDQISKFIILKNIFFTIDIYRNYNALFGLPIDFNLVFVLLIILIIISVNLVNLKTEFKSKASELNSVFKFKIAFALILGGIAGNLTDRFLYGFIIDYINLFNLFVFNIADLAICFGALLLSWKVLWK